MVRVPSATGSGSADAVLVPSAICWDSADVAQDRGADVVQVLSAARGSVGEARGLSRDTRAGVAPAASCLLPSLADGDRVAPDHPSLEEDVGPASKNPGSPRAGRGAVLDRDAAPGPRTLPRFPPAQPSLPLWAGAAPDRSIQPRRRFHSFLPARRCPMRDRPPRAGQCRSRRRSAGGARSHPPPLARSPWRRVRTPPCAPPRSAARAPESRPAIRARAG